MLRLIKGAEKKQLAHIGIHPKYDENTGKIYAYIAERYTYENGGWTRILRVLRFYKRKKGLVFRKQDEGFTLDETAFKSETYNYDEYCDFDLLYDLIKAGLVVKTK